MRTLHHTPASTGNSAVYSPQTSSQSKGLSARFEQAIDTIVSRFAKLKSKTHHALGFSHQQQTIQIGYKPSFSDLSSPTSLNKPLPSLPEQPSFSRESDFFPYTNQRFSVANSVDTSRSSLDNPVFFTPDSLQSSTAHLVTPATIPYNVPPAFAPNVVMRSVSELPGFADEATAFFSAMPTQTMLDSAPSLHASPAFAHATRESPQTRQHTQAPQHEPFFFEENNDSALSFPEFEPRE